MRKQKLKIYSSLAQLGLESWVSLIPGPKPLYHAVILPSYNYNLRQTINIKKRGREAQNYLLLLVLVGEYFDEKDGI